MYSPCHFGSSFDHTGALTQCSQLLDARWLSSFSRHCYFSEQCSRQAPRTTAGGSACDTTPHNPLISFLDIFCELCRSLFILSKFSYLTKYYYNSYLFNLIAHLTMAPASFLILYLCFLFCSCLLLLQSVYFVSFSITHFGFVVLL